MQHINSMQWRYVPSAEKVKSLIFIKKIFAFAVYISGVFYVVIIFVRYQETGTVDRMMAWALGMAYVIEIIAWNVWLREAIKHKDRVFTISNDYLEISEIGKNKTKRYHWKDFLSFSTNIRAYNKQAKQPIKQYANDKALYLGFSKEAKKMMPFVTLEFARDQERKIKELLKAKLPEVD